MKVCTKLPRRIMWLSDIMETPEMVADEGLGKSIEVIENPPAYLCLQCRGAKLLCGKPRCPIIVKAQSIARMGSSIETELKLTKAPRKILTLSEDTQPFGPSAPMERFKTSNPSLDRRIETCYYDRDLKAAEAVNDLYSRGVLVTRIQKTFSLGMFGEGGRRKIVPTRWSITAVDSTISQNLIDRVKGYPTIDEYRVYGFDVYDNQYVAILLPEQWMVEWVEAWFPKT